MATTNSSDDNTAIPRIVPFADIELITKDPSFDESLIDAIAQGFADFSSHKFNLCPIQTMGAPPMAPLVQNVPGYSAQVCVKSGYITGDEYFVIKVASGGHPMPNSGLMQVFSQETGKLQALLLDDGILTELRTAAAGAAAVKYLGPPTVHCIGIVGTGIQARYQLRYLKLVTKCRNLVIWGRTKAKAEALKRELEEDARNEWVVEIAESTSVLLETCNVIITTTCAREALLTGSPPTAAGPLLIVCIGADSVGKQELSVDLVAQADCLVCDSVLQTQERGEFQHGIRDGRVSLKNVLELGQVVQDASFVGKQCALTIFDSSGVAIQDCVVAKIVFEAEMKKGSK